MRVRRLNSHGLSEFSSFVSELRDGVTSALPSHLLDSEDSSESIDLAVEVPEVTFASRFDMGVLLVDLFGDADIQEYHGDPGFWSWFALLWFEQLCPNKNQIWKPSKEYNYILSADYRHRPRHSVFMTWQLVDRYREDARFMLCRDPSIRGEIAEQLLARQSFLTSDAAMRLASSLYMDTTSGTFKTGAAARESAGCVPRFIMWLQQLQLTYDIHSITKKQLESLLPDEFDRFREKTE